MKNMIHIAVCTNINYLPGAFVTLGSLLDSNGGKDDFCLHIMDTGIGDKGRQALTQFISRHSNATLQFHVIDDSCFTGCTKDYGGGMSAYARLLMGSLIDAPRCIYVDVDILVLKDVAEAWTLDMNGNIIMMVRDYTHDERQVTLDHDCPFEPPESIRHYPYYVSGFCVCDLNAWRAFDAEKKAFELMRQAPQALRAWDQTILNYLFRDCAGELDRAWAYYIDFEPFQENVNYHFITKKKPWGRRNYRPMNRLWHAYYRIRVRPFWRFRKPWKVRVYNVCWELRTFLFAFVFTEWYVNFRRKTGSSENAVTMTRILLKAYRSHILHGLDGQSNRVLAKLEKFWTNCATSTDE